ncbi:MAG TPA: Rrf2 family transcriptional regulator [Firmicutes bacterium]|nr:Rrf2 family transcriptional regulator [Bacillota bacterium]
MLDDKVITNKVEYLLRILMDLAENSTEGYVLSKNVAERQEIPPKYMPQLMALLTKKGWVTSVRGARGGVKLVADPKSISVYDVITAAGNPFLVKPCIDRKYRCSLKEMCPLLPIWERAQQEVDRVIRDVTLDTLMKNKKAKGGALHVQDQGIGQNVKGYQ